MINKLKTIANIIVSPIRFIQNNFKATILIVILIFLFKDATNDENSNVNLKRIEFTGAIMNANDLLAQLDDVKKNKKIKGVLLVVNSPGGAVAPSVEISYAIKELRALKPVVVYANGIIASGSYYASIWANKIIANPGSMVGSIGVIMQTVDISTLINNLGIKIQTIKTGKYKEVGTFTRKWSQYEEEELNKVIEDTYDMFVSDVTNARNLNRSMSGKYADAHIFTARQAKKVGLIDEVGTITTAKDILIEISGIKDPVWAKEDKIDKFVNNFVEKSITNVIMHISGMVAY